MSTNSKLGRIKMREWSARQQKEETLEKYAEAKSRVSKAYIVVQASWEERCKARNEVRRRFAITQEAAGTVQVFASEGAEPKTSADLPSPQDAILAFRYAQAVFERAKIAHIKAQKELRLCEFERDNLQKELEIVTAKHDDILKELEKYSAPTENH